MSKGMKLIMENWRKNIITEVQFNTVGDLRKAIEAAIQAKRLGKITDDLKNLGASVVIDMIPGGATIKSIFDLVKNTYEMPDNKKTNTGLDKLNIDDKVSKIVDDRIENQFLRDIAAWIKSKGDDERLSKFDITRELQRFIAREYDSRTITTPQQGN